MIVLAVAINFVGQIGGAFATNAWVLLLTRAFEGVALVFTVASAPLLIQRVVAPSRIGTSTGIYMLGGMLGATIGGVLTPTLFYSVGYTGLWLTFAAIAAVSGIIFSAYVRRDVGPLEDVTEEGGSNDIGDWRVFFRPNTLLFYVPFAIFQLVLLNSFLFASLIAATGNECCSLWRCQYSSYVVGYNFVDCLRCNIGQHGALQTTVHSGHAVVGAMLLHHVELLRPNSVGCSGYHGTDFDGRSDSFCGRVPDCSRQT